MDKPIAEIERTLRTLAAPFIADSIGKLIKSSASSGAIPWVSVRMVTVGAVKSGKTSTGILSDIYTPKISIIEDM